LVSAAGVSVPGALLVRDVRRIFGRTLWLRDVVNPLGSAIVAFLLGVGDALAGLASAGVFAIGMFSPAIRDRFGSKSKA
jgi:predicted membrane protein